MAPAADHSSGQQAMRRGDPTRPLLTSCGDGDDDHFVEYQREGHVPTMTVAVVGDGRTGWPVAAVPESVACRVWSASTLQSGPAGKSAHPRPLLCH